MKSKLVKICISIVTLLLAAVLLSTTFISPDKAKAAGRLFGIQNIIDRLNDSGEDYTMLEIVPDKAFASLGFLSKNCAPLIGDKVFAAGHTPEERKTLIFSALSSLKTNGFIEFNENYDERLYPLSVDDYKEAVISTSDDYYEERQGYFIESLDVPYALATHKIDPLYKLDLSFDTILQNGANIKNFDTYTPKSGDEITFNLNIKTTRNNYLKEDKVFQVISENVSNSITFLENKSCTFESSSAIISTDEKEINIKFSYFISADDLSKTLNFSADDANYFSNTIVIEIPASESESGSFSIIDSPASNFDEDYVACPENEAKFVWIDDPSNDSHKVYFNKIYYALDYAPTGLFASKVLELNPDSAEEQTIVDRIKVETITPSEMFDVDFSSYDFLYLSQTTALDLPDEVIETFDKFSHTNDISWEAAYNIFEAVTNAGLPIVVDRSILGDLSDWDSSRIITENPSPKSGSHVSEPTYEPFDVPEQINRGDSDSCAVSKMVSGYNYLRLAYLLRYFLATQDSYLPSADESVFTYTFTNNIVACGPDWLNTGKVHGSEFKYNQVFDYGEYGAISGNVFINGYYKDGKNLNLLRSGLDTKICSYWEGFTKSFEVECRMKGFVEMANEIINDNFYNNSLGTVLTSDFAHDGDYDRVDANGYSFLRYIVNYYNRRLMLYKDKIRVLDLEPTRFSTLTVEQIKTWFGTSSDVNKVSEFEIVQMNTLEFCGKIEDLVENYDIIYIGSCIGPDGKLGSLPQDKKGNVIAKTVNDYNQDFYDDNYKNLIYTHIGHYTHIDSSRSAQRGLKSTDYEYNILGGKIKSGTSGYYSRYSGNDINKNKYKELTEFVLAGYPVVVSSKFFNSTGKLSNTYIDKYSYLYKFLDLVTNGGSYTHSNYDLHGNLITKTENITKMGNVIIQTNNSMPSLVKYANMPRLSISLLDKPTEYSINEDRSGMITNVTYLEKSNGKYFLSYTFEISNTAEIRPATSFYKVRIFTDTNADGKFNGLEELDDLSVIEADTGLTLETNQLKSGVRYTVTRELSDNYIGLIPWKLVIELYEDTNFSAKTSVKGYTAVKATSVTIKVLQITGPSNELDYNLVLSKDANFKKYFGNVSSKLGYSIQMTTVPSDNIVNVYKNGRYKSGEKFFTNYLDNFDMIIIGFEDCYKDIDSDEVMEGLQLFIKAGKSVLFSHDTTSFHNHYVSANTSWGYHMNIMIRSLVGLDRFGITANNTLREMTDGISDVNSATYKSIEKFADENSFDVPYMPDGTISAYSEGFNSYELSFKKYNDYAYVYSENLDFSDGSRRPTKITQVNDGQITTFPYDLNVVDDTTRTKYSSSSNYMVEKHKTIDIAMTHAQYYQLNTDMDKNGDGIADLVVWYCLAGDAFDAVPNDTLNSYYIYTVGNVTYTGMGHFYIGFEPTKLSVQEIKLFINCILASYRSGIKAPSVGITSDTTNKNNTLSYLYRTSDAINGISFDADEHIGIFAKDINVVQAQKSIKYRLYYEITQEEYDAGILSGVKNVYETTEIDGETIYLKAYSLNEDDDDFYGNFFEFDSSSPGFISEEDIKNGVMKNDKILGITLKADWLNAEMEKALAENKAAKLYFGAWTVLTYVENNNVQKETTKSITSLSIKNRELFDLD